MQIPLDAARGTVPVPSDPLQTLFDDPLRRAAQQLIDLGQVSDVRLLHSGRVVTGIAGDRQRVYIRYTGAGTETLDGECSCGEASPCRHVAAVAMTAADILGAPPHPRTGMDAGVLTRPSPQLESALPRNAPPRQSLCYLLEPDPVRGIGISTWVTQTSSGDAHAQLSACPFAPRQSDSYDDYPRYVTAQDRSILDELAARRFAADLKGAAGFELLQRAIATGHAYWRTLEGRPLRVGATRAVPFVWHVLPNGDQRLIDDAPEPLDFLLELEPAVYIDTASGACGPLELPYPVDLLRQYWNRPAIEPANVSVLIANLGRTPHASGFPRPREMTVQESAFSSLRPRLVLAAGPTATLHLIYNGMAVDSGSLRAADRVVRCRDGDVVYQVIRSEDLERQLHAQFERLVPDTGQGAQAWLAFMLNAMPALDAAGWEIVIAPDFPYRVAATDDWYADLKTTQVRQAVTPPGARQSCEWFDLRLGVMVDGHAVNVLPALVQYLQGALGLETAGSPDLQSVLTREHLLIRLEDGRYLPVPLTRIERIADTLVELYDRDGLNEHHALRLRKAQAARLTQFALDVNAPIVRSDDPSLLDVIDAVESHSNIESLAAPPHFRAELRPYQAAGLGWLQFLRRHGMGGILADDMGLGKTVQTLAHLLIEKQQQRLRKPSLIVAPVSVLGNWQQESSRFSPDLELLVIHGAKRKQSYAAMDSADIIVIGYPLLLLERELLLAREFCFVILDEAQTIKNPQAKVSQVARALRAEHRLCLTGTPMENHLGELWSLLDFLQPGLLGDRSHFQRHYRTPIENDGNTLRAAALSRRIQPYLLRRTKNAVARDLPPKLQIVEPIELDERQRDFYDGIRLGQHQRVRDAIKQQGLARSHITVLDALLKLRQACCDPRLVNPQLQPPLIPSAKLEWLSITLPELVAAGRRILLFSQFTSMLRLIETVAKELSISYCMLTGETRQRTELVRQFQTGDAPLFLISLKAGGTGLNLTAADTIIHYDPWWNPAVEAQATDRAHRIGQDKPVFVYKLIAQRTVEEKILRLQADKQALMSQLYAAKSGLPSHLNSADLETLFAP